MLANVPANRYRAGWGSVEAPRFISPSTFLFFVLRSVHFYSENLERGLVLQISLCSSFPTRMIFVLFVLCGPFRSMLSLSFFSIG